MKKILSYLPIITLLLLEACAQHPRPSQGNTAEKGSAGSPPTPGEQAASSPVATMIPAPPGESLLEYAGRFADMSSEMQKKELSQLAQNSTRNRNDFNSRMKAALVYALPGSRVRDTGKAQILLDDLLREKTLDSEKRALADILKDLLAENNKYAQKTHDEQKRADTLQQKLEASQQRADALQQKLDDLKSIEKTMIDRDAGTRK